MKRFKSGILTVIAAVLTMLAAFAIPVCAEEQEGIDLRIWHKVYLKPGESYDATDAKMNTTVFISKAGNYTLSGKSEYVRVVIECGDVNVYLADGLNLNCTKNTYSWTRTSPINIGLDGDPGGTVKLISKKNAITYLEGYMAPGIRKDGTKTKLVFETEDPNVPGNIEAKGGVYSAGIGGIFYAASTASSTGNIVFNSGNILAKGGSNSAGIGGGDGGGVNGITINGGDIRAFGSGQGAGIGGGKDAEAKNIYINGGTVNAGVDDGVFSSTAAAIGSGGDGIGYHAKNIIISGGDVTAIAMGGVGIGAGGDHGILDNLEIKGGKVHAESKEKCGAGIGCSQYGTIKDIRITGGQVYAKGGEGAPGIGAFGHDPDSSPKMNLTITGGIVEAVKGKEWSHGVKCDIGMADNAKSGDVNVTITGGSVKADSVQYPKNSDGAALHMVDVTLDGTGDGTKIESFQITGGKYAYGTNDLLTQKSKIYMWLPANGSQTLTEAVVLKGKEESLYFGSIAFTATSGTLNHATKITLLPQDGQPGTSGSAYAVRGETRLRFITRPNVPEKRILKWYNIPGGITALAEYNGDFLANTAYTDGSKRWTFAEEKLTLYYTVETCMYTVKFDGNQPPGASTTVDKYKPDMVNLLCDTEYDVPKNDPPNEGFILPGYEFKGWKKDPKGTSPDFVVGEKFSNLATKDGAVVTLYAHWEPMKYTIILKSGTLTFDGYERSFSQVMTFDKHERIPALPDEWRNNGQNKHFNHWKDETTGKYYDDLEDFVNLETLDQNNNLNGHTLTAQWVNYGTIYAVVTCDGEPQDQVGNFTLTYGPDSDAVGGSFHYDSSNKIYDFTPNSPLAAGQYTLKYELAGKFYPVERTFNFESGGAVTEVFDYYTVDTKVDSIDRVDSTGIEWKGCYSTGTGKSVYVPDDGVVTIISTVKDKAHFTEYAVMGTIPQKEDGSGPFDPTIAVQKIKITGTAVFTACSEYNTYTIRYDANATSGVSGTMEDQKIACDNGSIPKKTPLSANKFTRLGETFIKWNTKADGTGTDYTDGQEVVNLTKTDGEVITLYAQWTETPYRLDINLDGGTLPAGSGNPDKYKVDTPSFTLVNPTKEDNDFTGWIGTGISEPQMEVTIPEGSIGDRKYTATWAEKHFYVRFDTGEGLPVESQRILIHGTAVKPEDPTQEGYTFTGWYADAALTKAFDFATKIENDITLYAGWKKNVEPQPTPPQPTPPQPTPPEPEVVVLEPTSKSKSLSATIGGEYKFVPTPTLIGEGSTVVSMTIANPKVATIDPDGTIHLIKKGTTKIQIKVTYPKTVTKRVKEKYTDEKGKTKSRYVKQTVTEEKTKTISITLKVKEPVVVKKVGLNKTKVTLDLNKKNKSLTLKASFSPSNAPNKEVRFESLNPDIVSVSQNGNEGYATITALKVGQAKVRVTSLDKNGASKTISVKVVDKGVVSGVKLNKKSASVKMNSKSKTVQLKATVKPNTARNKTVTWESSDPSVATVDNNGKVTALNPGKATITAKSTENAGFMSSCTITVKEK